MFSVEKYYERAHSGEKINDVEIIKYIKKFKHVVIWGGSYLGKAIGKYLLSKGVEIENYWDIRSEELSQVNGIQVIKPFTTQDNENTLVIICIANNVLITKLLLKLKEQKYENVLRGDFLYEGTVCKFDKTTGINAKQCSGTMECRQIYCHRLGNIIKSNNTVEDPIHLTSVTLIINSICSMKCKFCTSYMNEYPTEKRKNIPFKRISEDIDKFFDTVDSVGTITVMGGEPFMHPDLSKIIEKLCEKKNFGLISIATSGTYPIMKEQLSGLYDERVNVSFSNYTESSSENQKKMFYENIGIVKNAGVCHTVGLFSPEWIIPSTLYRKECTENDMVKRKEKCINWHQIKNGKLHPCDLATAIYSLGIKDYESDYVDLTLEISRDEMRNNIRNYINKSFYQSCAHHVRVPQDGIGVGMTSKAAEQGYMDFKKPLNSLKK